MGSSTTIKLAKIIKDCDISAARKTNLVYFFVLPIETYGRESWTLRKADQQRLKSFKM